MTTGKTIALTRLDGHEFEQTPGDGEGQESLTCCSPWGHKELNMTERLNNMSLSISLFVYQIEHNEAYACNPG